jgi:hypothetical protein
LIPAENSAKLLFSQIQNVARLSYYKHCVFAFFFFVVSTWMVCMPLAMFQEDEVMARTVNVFGFCLIPAENSAKLLFKAKV